MLNEYPKMIKEWGARSNSKRSCENFLFKNGKFLYKSQRVVVISKQQLEILKDIHKGVGQSTHSKAMASHKGRVSAIQK